ncbi:MULTISPECIES: helix-turn-helix transcriptional regulator [unclassified Streptomyces]|jgi:transcriptional regulator with XRE-family HTH domain|uniref:helix-turn-helix domain-containing protein n=1 Tax=unclassified Streptomyces TaxID=2593676 RepID=UPI00235B31DB|nr:helix-turn-helix transcriptional regulator [Streptomyces sp. TUS-ST3]GLP69788.1 transcriptional regulator [Streptomyces sp. TUS-ST3]
MATAGGPTVRRRQLGAELRRLREQAGHRIEDVATHLECSMSKISRVETGQAPIKARDVRDLLEWYGVTDPVRIETVMQIHKDAQQQGWWTHYGEVLPSGLATYAGLETDARVLRSYEQTVVHGLLQTEDYARSVIATARPNQPHETDQLVRFRKERQALLTRQPDPLELWVVMEESALLRPVGGNAVMADQLRHLAELTAMPNVTLQIMPTAKGAHAALGGPFSLLEFEPHTPTVVYVESAAGNVYLEKERDVRTFIQTFDLLRAAAPDPHETPARLEQLTREIQNS